MYSDILSSIGRQWGYTLSTLCNRYSFYTFLLLRKKKRMKLIFYIKYLIIFVCMNRFVRFEIPAEVYENGLIFIFSRDISKTIRQINKIQDIKDNRYSVDEFECRGKIFFRRGYVPVIWMPDFPKTNRELATLCHEILHGVNWILNDWAGMPLSRDSDEAYCHLHTYFFTKCLDTIDRIRIRIKKQKIK